MSDDKKPDKMELARDRTDWAEDRTILANERTFAGWMRTGLASVGIGLGFQAIFKEVEPTWVAKCAATMFVLIGIFIFFAAWRRSVAVLSRLDHHSAEPIRANRMGFVSFLFSLGSAMLALVIWLLL